MFKIQVPSPLWTWTTAEENLVNGFGLREEQLKKIYQHSQVSNEAKDEAESGHKLAICLSVNR